MELLECYGPACLCLFLGCTLWHPCRVLSDRAAVQEQSLSRHHIMLKENFKFPIIVYLWTQGGDKGTGSTSWILEVPHLGAFLDRLASCLNSSLGEPGYRERPLPFLQLDSELVEFHKGRGQLCSLWASLCVDLILFDDRKCGGRQLGRHCGQWSWLPHCSQKTEGFSVVSSATGQMALQSQRPHRDRTPSKVFWTPTDGVRPAVGFCGEQRVKTVIFLG